MRVNVVLGRAKPGIVLLLLQVMGSMISLNTFIIIIVLKYIYIIYIVV